MHRVILVGSPRQNGNSATVANEIFEACMEECPEDGVSIVSISSVEVSGCTGCDACKKTLDKDDPRYPQIPEKADPLSQCNVVFRSDANAHQCVIPDDMHEVRKHIDAADELIIVSPVYFSGAPSQFKAALDRMQPYYWSNLRTRTKQRRPITLHIVRAGGDPHGFDALISVVESAFGVAGFKLERMFDWIDCFDDSGQIIADATEYELAE